MPQLSPVQLGRTIARLRKQAGYSQEGFAHFTKFHRTYMGHLERGEYDLRLSTIARIADALGLTAGELLRKAEDKRRRR